MLAQGRIVEKVKAVDVARRVRDELLPQITGPINFKKHLGAEETEADGWSVTIATYQKIDIELYLDRFPRSARRCFWFGFFCSNRRPIQALVNGVPARLRPVKEFSAKDVNSERGVWMLTVPLSSNDAGIPIIEKLTEGTFYGMYDFGRLTPEGELSSDVRSAAGFLKDVLASRPDLEIDEARDDYSGAENRRIVSLHLRRERDPELARRRKEYDGYRCQICKLTFEDVYGDIGYRFAEAHHIIPLSELSGPVDNRIEDLITVCSNCHRMLHRLPGEERDIDELTQ
jgi:5-methylcytosine-specific restriction endonuclease McrA